jgi:hypothetical protein
LLESKIDLTTSVAIRHGNPNKFLIHISGKLWVLNQLCNLEMTLLHTYKQRSAWTRIICRKCDTIAYFKSLFAKELRVFIHALNPYGFATNRRANEDNIDINRNLLDKNQFEFVRSRDPNYAKYVDMDATMNPTWFPLHNVIVTKVCLLYKTIKSIILYGMFSIKTGKVSLDQ